MMYAAPQSPAPDRIRVFCVDDNPHVAEAVALTMKGSARGNLDLAGSASTADMLLAEAENAGWSEGQAPDIVLLDIDMPGRSAFDAIGELGRICGDLQSKPRVIMYSGLVEKKLVERALEAGAWGYVAKCDSTEELLAAIREVAGGSFAFSPSIRDLAQGYL
jgi:DNA-binding NarL/FixJ family response regulator